METSPYGSCIGIHQKFKIVLKIIILFAFVLICLANTFIFFYHKKGIYKQVDIKYVIYSKKSSINKKFYTKKIKWDLKPLP
jgi:hypothetical protein